MCSFMFCYIGDTTKTVSWCKKLRNSGSQALHAKMQGGLCMKSCDRSPRVKEMRCLTNFVIESLHILILTVVGAAKHGDHTCMTNTDPFPLKIRSLSAQFSTVQSATTTCVKHQVVSVNPISSQVAYIQIAAFTVLTNHIN